jgi:type I restriction enzyme S subunit
MGNICHNTSKTRLSDVAHVIMGQSPGSETYRDEPEGLPFFQGKADFGELYPTPRKYCISPIKIAEANDVLISVRAPVGPTNIANVRCCLGRGLAAVRAKENKIVPKFLYYVLAAAGEFLVSRATGTTFLAISRADIDAVTFFLPPLAEQQRIVEILDRAAAIQRLRRAAEEKAREIIPALFVDMFGDPATNPKGWPLATIGDVLQRIETGKNVMAGSGRSPFRILKVSAVTSGIYDEQESKPAPDNFEPDARSIVRVGDFLFSRANTAELVGATTIVNSSDGLTLLPDKLWRLVWSERVDATYMLGVLQNRTVRAAISREASGTSASMRNVSQGKLLGIRFPLAPPELQRIYADRSAALAGVARLTLNASQYAHALQHAVTTATLTEA